MKIRYFFTVVLFAVAIFSFAQVIDLATQAPAAAPEKTYSTTLEVVAYNEQLGAIIGADENGDGWEIYTTCPYEIGTKLQVLMFNNNTPDDIYDDIALRIVED